MRPSGPSIGDLVDILEHHLEGYAWTVGRVGSIVRQAHEKGFDAMGTKPGSKARAERTPPIKPGWWVVSVESDTAKGGYAYAGLPEELLAPHACSERCGKHLCQ